jgi:hypothetical protein
MAGEMGETGDPRRHVRSRRLKFPCSVAEKKKGGEKMKNLIEKSNKLLNSWQDMAPMTRFCGLSLETFRSTVKPAIEISESIAKADQDRVARVIERDAALKKLNASYLLVVNGIKGSDEHGEDSALYGSIGYKIRSARQSGLTRLKKDQSEAVAAK